MKKPDCAPQRGPLGMSDDELAELFLASQNAEAPIERWDERSRNFPEEMECARKQAEEEFWRSFREKIEIIGELRAIHPTAPQLAMSADEIAAYYWSRAPGPRTEAQRQADLKIVSRLQPGKKASPSEPSADKYLALRAECLAEAPGNVSRARQKFLKQAQIRFGVSRRTAENNWSRLWGKAGK
jgi:hypothetical protein